MSVPEAASFPLCGDVHPCADAFTPHETGDITMKTSILLALAMLTAVPAVSQADLIVLRQMDDMTFDTMNDARQLRWLIRNEFVESPAIGLLLSDSQMLLLQLRALEDGLFRELPTEILFSQLNQVRAAAAQLRFSLTTPCVTCLKPDVVFYGGERFVIEEPRPVIVVPTDLALEMLTGIEGKLQAIEDVMLGRVVPAVEAVPPGGAVLLDGAALPAAGIEGVAPGLDAIPAGPLTEGGLPIDGLLPMEGALPMDEALPLEGLLPMGGDLIGLPPMGQI
jgi:hypothetical protein